MRKPSSSELASAFQEAKRLIWQEQDKHFLAKSLFALSDRWDELSKVLTSCDSYFRSGKSTLSHRKLVSAMNAYRNMYSEDNLDYVVNVSDEELSMATATADILREKDKDTQFIAKTILNLDYLVRQLETVQKAAERYFHTGTSETEQLKLEAAIKKYRAAENRASGEDVASFGVL